MLWPDTMVNIAQWAATEAPLAYICAGLLVLPLIVKMYTQQSPSNGQGSTKYGNSSLYKDPGMHDEIPLNAVRVRTLSPNAF
jgi:hypothetical protein